MKKGGGGGVHVTGKRNACRVWWENLKEKDHLEDLGVDKKKEVRRV
jgi:hypothetical protein